MVREETDTHKLSKSCCCLRSRARTCDSMDLKSSALPTELCGDVNILLLLLLVVNATTDLGKVCCPPPNTWQRRQLTVEID